jgi:hypothetical protein
LHRSTRPLSYWILATFLLCLACSSRRIARELGVHVRTGYRWCWWLRNAALSYEMHRQLDGTMEADDLYQTAGNKGQAKQGGKKALGRRARGRRKKREPGRGHFDKDRPAIIAWVSRQGAVVIQATKDFTVKTVQKAADLVVRKGNQLYTDSASSYRRGPQGRAFSVGLPPNRTRLFTVIRLSSHSFRTVSALCITHPCRSESRVTCLPSPRERLSRSQTTMETSLPWASRPVGRPAFQCVRRPSVP